MDYYEYQLNRLGNIKKYSSIKITCEGKNTNFLDINKESLKALKNWINNIKLD